jgi:hypothetical protein
MVAPLPAPTNMHHKTTHNHNRFTTVQNRIYCTRVIKTEVTNHRKEVSQIPSWLMTHLGVSILGWDVRKIF